MAFCLIYSLNVSIPLLKKLRHCALRQAAAALPVARTAARTATRTAAQRATRTATRTGARALARGALVFSPTAAVATKILALVAAAPYLLSFVTVFQL